MADEETGLYRPGTKKPRRGGIQQRLDSSGSDNVQHSSDLALLLLALVAAGQLSAPLMCAIAVAACKDIAKTSPKNHSFPMLERLRTPSPRHAWQIAYSVMKSVCSLPALYRFHMPALIRGVETTCSQGILLPHELFACLYHSDSYRHIWDTSLVPDTRSLS